MHAGVMPGLLASLADISKHMQITQEVFTPKRVGL